MSQYYLGIDVGSTTIKAYLTDEKDHCLYSQYTRHHSDVRNTILKILEDIEEKYTGINVHVVMTGHVLVEQEHLLIKWQYYCKRMLLD